MYPDSSDGRGHYLGRDLGDVVISGTTFQAKGDDGRGGLASEPQTLPLQGHNTERRLGDFQFVIGDFVECAILPPLEDGSVMPTITSTRAVILYVLIHVLITNIRCSNRLIEGHSIQLPPLPIA